MDEIRSSARSWASDGDGDVQERSAVGAAPIRTFETRADRAYPSVRPDPDARLLFARSTRTDFSLFVPVRNKYKKVKRKVLRHEDFSNVARNGFCLDRAAATAPRPGVSTVIFLLHSIRDLFYAGKSFFRQLKRG